MAIKKYNSDSIESIKIKINEEDHPQVFKAKVDELVSSGLGVAMAKTAVRDMEFDVELYYSPGLGMFGVEAEAVECADLVDPYTGDLLEEEEY